MKIYIIHYIHYTLLVIGNLDQLCVKRTVLNSFTIRRPPTYTRGRSSSSLRSPLSNSKRRTTTQARQWSLSRPKPSITCIQKWIFTLDFLFLFSPFQLCCFSFCGFMAVTKHLLFVKNKTACPCHKAGPFFIAPQVKLFNNMHTSKQDLVELASKVFWHKIKVYFK